MIKMLKNLKINTTIMEVVKYIKQKNSIEADLKKLEKLIQMEKYIKQKNFIEVDLKKLEKVRIAIEIN